MASGTFKTGRYSKFLPARLTERYHEAISDGELLALRDEIGLIDARTIDVLKRVDSGESGALWNKLRDTLNELVAARDRRDADAMRDNLTALERLIARGHADYAAWSDVRSLLEQKRKLVESERKRLVEMQQMLSTEQAMVMLAAVVDTVKRHVSDREALAAISSDIRALVNRQP